MLWNMCQDFQHSYWLVNIVNIFNQVRKPGDHTLCTHKKSFSRSLRKLLLTNKFLVFTIRKTVPQYKQMQCWYFLALQRSCASVSVLVLFQALGKNMTSYFHSLDSTRNAVSWYWLFGMTEMPQRKQAFGYSGGSKNRGVQGIKAYWQSNTA